MSVCCQKIAALYPTSSPFMEKIVLNWQDLPLEGVVRCDECSREYYFRDLGEDEDSGLTIYGLFDLPAGTLQRVKRLLPAKYPIWEFESTSVRQTADSSVQKIRDTVRRLSWVFATSDFEEIRAWRSGTEVAFADVTNGKAIDWLQFLFEGVMREIEKP